MTTEEYKQRLQDNNPNVEMLGEFINFKTNILFHCKKHNVDFYNHPWRVLKGVGCSQCSKENLKKSKTKTHEWYLKELKIKNPSVIPLEKYIDIKTPIIHKCLLHEIEWKTSPSITLLGCGCEKCMQERIGLKNSKTNNEYIQELQLKHINLLPLEEYKNASTNILHKCLDCGYEWKVRPGNILSGKGCPKCKKNLRRTHEQYITDVKDCNPNIEVIETYVNANTPINHKCLIHNYIWKATPSYILKGGGCCQCGKEKLSKKMRKTNKQYVEELNAINPNIITLEEYRTSSDKIKFKCLMCNHEWIANPENTIRGHGCPRCNISTGENQIEQWLNNHNIKYEPQKRFNECKDKRILPFDFYLPIENKCVEYDGLQHFKSIDYFGGQENLEYTQYHDQIKNEYCKNNNIPLLRIPYYADINEELTKFLLN